MENESKNASELMHEIIKELDDLHWIVSNWTDGSEADAKARLLAIALKLGRLRFLWEESIRERQKIGGEE